MNQTKINPPHLILVGGPNGVGKTTVALEYAAQHQLPYLGADAIATKMDPDNLESVKIQASQQFILTLQQNIENKSSFVCESTLSGLTMRRHLESAKNVGYTITCIFLFIDSAEDCIQRVEERVRKGGHHVPKADVIRRYQRALTNFWNRYRMLSDHWSLIYNGDKISKVVATGFSDLLNIHHANLFAIFQELAGDKND